MPQRLFPGRGREHQQGNAGGKHKQGGAKALECLDVHTSQNETLLYNDLGNAYEERITRLRIRICDIEGTPSSNLGEFTFGCLEVRENPLMRQAKMLRSIMRGEERSALDYQNNLQPNRGNNFQ